MQTHITFVLDSSGSMSAIKDDTIGGFNTFLDEQRDEDGEATVTLFNFNTNVERVYQGRPIDDAPELSDDTYTPSGRTALHDAIVTAIDDATARINDLDADDEPENVVVVVLTDGKENASETPQDTVREHVETQQDEHDWEFLFIGANQDAALTAEGIGVDAGKALSMDHSGEGTQAAYASTSQQVSRVRQQGQTSGYDEQDRERQTEAGRSS